MIDIAEGRRYLSKRRGALAVREPGAPEADATLVPFDEIESVIVHTPEATFSSGAIAELSRRGIPLVCCDTAHMPVSWLWPARANHEQTRRMAAQAAMPEERRDALWARLVRAKIGAQADLLRELGAPADDLLALARGVLPGDRGAAESQAARKYWWLLFEGFRRDPAGTPPNGLLNYGYAVLRATAARQLCAAGLHPLAGPPPPQPLQRLLPGRRPHGAVPPGHRPRRGVALAAGRDGGDAGGQGGAGGGHVGRAHD